MLFKAFRLKNYKSFLDSGLCRVQDTVTILAGQNESGKTNALTALTKINNPTPSFSEEEHCFFTLNVANPEIEYHFELTKDEHKDLMETHGLTSLDQNVIVRISERKRQIEVSFLKKEGDEDISATITKSVLDQIGSLIPKFVLYKTLTDDLPDRFSAGDLSKVPLKRLSKYLDVDFAKIFSNPNPQIQQSLIQNLSQAISDDFVSKYKQKNVSFEFALNNSNIYIYIHDNDDSSSQKGFPFMLSQRSTGLGWYINFYVALKGEDLSPGDVILVDEPGMYLHPKAQEEMRGILNEVGTENQIIYSTHSPYLIDSDKLYQIRIVEKKETIIGGAYNEISEIVEKLHRSGNSDALRPIVDAIGYKIGSELNLSNKSILICEGVSDYYYLKALELLMGQQLACGITHAGGATNIGYVSSLYLGLGTTHIYVLVDSDAQGSREKTRLIRDWGFDENSIFMSHEPKNTNKAIEDIFSREWFLSSILEYSEEQVASAESLLSKEVSKPNRPSKYILAKSLYDKASNQEICRRDAINESGENLFKRLYETIGAV